MTGLHNRKMAATLLLMTVGLTACAAPEQPLLDQFFAASRLRDTTALQPIATVVFEPLEQGIVRTFRISAVTPERMNGGLATKDVGVTATVVLPDGRTVEKNLIVTMQRAENAYGWVIVSVIDPARQ